MKTITVESREDTLEIEFTPTFEEHLAVEEARLARHRRAAGKALYRYLALGVPLVLAVIAWLMLFFSGDLNTLAELAVVLFLIAVAAGVGGTRALAWYENRGLATARNRGTIKRRWIAGTRGLRRIQGGAVTEIPWTSVRSFRRLAGHLVLYIDELEVHAIPDRAFVTEQQQVRFLKLVKTSLGASRAS